MAQVHLLYKTTCLPTGRYYVGMHSTTNPNDGYMGSGVFITRSLKKYGKTAHRFEVLGTYETRQQLKEAEKSAITTEMLNGGSCMNVAPGGGGGRLPGFNHTAATKLKIGQKNRERDPSVNERISAALTGRKNPLHAERQMSRFSDVRNHPRTKTFVLQSPEGETFTLVGVDALSDFCVQKSLSLGALLKNKGAAVQLTPKLKTAGKNTVGWQVGEQA